MVHRRKLVSRTLFRKLPAGAKYWLSAAVNVAPSIKVGKSSKAGAFVTPILTKTAIFPATGATAVVKVPEFLVRQGN